MKQYRVSKHAEDRAVKRLGYERSNAKNNLQQLMQTAVHVGTVQNKQGKSCEVRDHIKSRTRMILDGDLIVTVYAMPEPLTSNQTKALPEELKDAIKRKSNTIIKNKNRSLRALKIAIAEKNLEIAHLKVNLAKAKAPKTIDAINEKLSAGEVEYDALKLREEKLETDIKSISKFGDLYV
ncbi:hypothetical protein [Bacillus stratosphericus]|uniref:hypothetical protein n=1 Tax=Bacillus stratosphericus TaxID=293386 RepID=UPI001CFA82F3|nr:hypothetical protein [Bacillus stratosphericus]